MSSLTLNEDILRSVLAERGLPLEDGHQSPLCERALVGALLIDCGLRRHCAELYGEEFGDRALGRIFDLIMSEDGPVDLVIAVDKAERAGLAKITGREGLATYMASLLDLVPDVENVPAYAKRVKSANVAREVARELEEMRLARARRMGT